MLLLLHQELDCVVLLSLYLTAKLILMVEVALVIKVLAKVQL